MSLADDRRSVAASQLHCIGCNYDLTGTAIGGACPECGEPVGRTIDELRSPRPYKGVATACFWFGIVSVLPFAWFLIPVVIVFFILARINVRRGLAPRSSLVRANVGFGCSMIGLALFILFILSSTL